MTINTKNNLNENEINTEDKVKLNWNVIEESQFRNRVRQLFEKVASMLTNTLGPYGATTIIEKFGDTHFTKDGWQILKKISFDDSTNNNIMNLLTNISAQVVIKVGDGSTSSIVAANQILKSLEQYPELKKIRPKEFIDILTKCVDNISEVILKSAKQINVDNDPELNEIFKLAMISTNGDKKVSEIIQNIYKETRNPSIEYLTSKTNKTHFEIVEGYQGNITYLDRLYVNNDNETCDIDSPWILMFDHKIDKEVHFDKIILPVLQKAVDANKRLVIVAPNYDRFFLDAIATQANLEYKSLGTTATVYTKVFMTNNIAQEQYGDFVIMTGGTMIRENNVHDILENEKVDIMDFVGEVEKISIGPAKTHIKGFIKRSEEMYTLAKNDALSKFKKKEATHSELNIVNSELYELKKRISKLSGIMGIIYVGGNSALEKKGNLDLVEDAVKACENAFSYGYNIGGNLIIPIAIKQIIEDNEDTLSPEEITIFRLMWQAFGNVFRKVVENKFKNISDEEYTNIFGKCVNEKTCYDLITDTYSQDIINPCYTDIEILRASTSIISLLVSSNQYISIKINEEE